jgi:hypothetical protein
MGMNEKQEVDVPPDNEGRGVYQAPLIIMPSMAFCCNKSNFVSYFL